jgi:hypothetical protein
MKNLIYASALLLTFGAASATTARAPKARIEVVYQGQTNGDYRLYLFGSDRSLVCEEKELKVVSSGDAVNPVVISCDHGDRK